LKTPILLGIIAVTILGTIAVQGMMVQAGVLPIETIQVIGPEVVLDTDLSSGSSSAQCPPSHPFLIGGSYLSTIDSNASYRITPSFDTVSNTYTIVATLLIGGGAIITQPFALCANFNFPMAVGGLIIPIDTIALLAAGIGVDPIITGLLLLSMVGISFQVGRMLHKRKEDKKK